MAIEIPNAFIAGARLKGTATIAVNSSEGFDVSSFVRNSAGSYNIDLTEEIDEENTISSIVAADGGGAPLIAYVSVTTDHKTLVIATVNAAGVATDAAIMILGVWLFKSA